MENPKIKNILQLGEIMKIKFEDLEYQNDAINSIVKIFEGQESLESNFTVQIANNTQLELGHNSTELTDLGIANNIKIYEEEILQNIQKIQLENGLPQTKKLDTNNLNFGYVPFNCGI